MRCRVAARHPSSTGDAFTMTQFDHSTFISPFTWRYGSGEMRSVFSEEHKRLLLRRIWIALARAEAKAGLVSDEQVAELEAHGKDIDIERASLIETEIRHDLMAEIRTYAEQCPKAGSIIHLGATSMDILDNMDAIRLKEALGIIIDRTRDLLSAFLEKMEAYADVPCMAFTHLQPAEITTVGYRFSQSAQDLLEDMEELERTLSSIRGKGMKGAVGTGASYAELVRGRGMSAMDLEKEVMDELGLECFDATTQIYTRKQDLRVVQTLSGLCCTMYRFAADFRILMSPPIGEWSEPFGSRQVGSSAMPFKRNPINCEKVDSLTRYVSSLYMTAWQNGATTFLERTLDDSANRRLMLPQAFLATEEALVTLTKVVKGMGGRVFEPPDGPAAADGAGAQRCGPPGDARGHKAGKSQDLGTGAGRRRERPGQDTDGGREDSRIHHAGRDRIAAGCGLLRGRCPQTHQNRRREDQTNTRPALKRK